MSLDDLKRQAAEKAVESVESGMVLGLGSGSTAVHAVRAVGQRLQDGRLQNVVGIPTSDAVRTEAENCGLPLATLDEQPIIDLTIDGADEIDPHLNLIKGLGGALLREKVVAMASEQFVIVADHTKRVDQLGTRSPLPVEVIRFARRPVAAYLETLGAQVVLREEGEQPFITDEGNIILDCFFEGLDDPVRLAQVIRAQPGVVEHGLFLGIATAAVVAAPSGVTVLRRS